MVLLDIRKHQTCFTGICEPPEEEKVFLEILQISQENTYVRVFFLIKFII